MFLGWETSPRQSCSSFTALRCQIMIALWVLFWCLKHIVLLRWSRQRCWQSSCVAISSFFCVSILSSNNQTYIIKFVRVVEPKLMILSPPRCNRVNRGHPSHLAHILPVHQLAWTLNYTDQLQPQWCRLAAKNAIVKVFLSLLKTCDNEKSNWR